MLLKWVFFLIGNLATALGDAGNHCDDFLPGSKFFDGKCFLMVEKHMRLADAQKYCEAMESFPAEPKTTELNDFLRTMAIERFGTAGDNSFLIGGIKSNGIWKWMSSDETLTTSAWEFNEPNVSTENHMILHQQGNWRWHNTADLPYMFICQRDVGEPCEGQFPGASYGAGQCWRFFDTPLRWHQAQEICKGHDAFLAEPKTEALSDALNTYMDTQIETEFWIGGTDEETEDIFKWATSGEVFTYKNWKAYEPNNWGDKDHVKMTINKKWQDTTKVSLLPFVCQKAYNPNTVQRYMAIHPAIYNDDASEKLHITSGFRSRTVYLKIQNSEDDKWLKKSVSWTKSLHYRLSSTLRISETGIHQKWIQIIASDSITVVLRSKNGNSAENALMYALGEASGTYFFVPSPSMAESQDSPNKLLAITGTLSDQPTRVTFQKQHKQILGLNTSVVETMNSYMISVNSGVLNGSLNVLYIHSSRDMNGAFVDTDQDVTVLVGLTGPVEDDGTVHGTALEYVLPLELTGKEYITLPFFYPLCRIIALHDDTIVTVNDGVSGRILHEISLASVGDVKDVILNASFHLVKGNQPFYIFQFALGPEGQEDCMTSLYPESLWRYQYDFRQSVTYDGYEVEIHVVLLAGLTSMIRVNDLEVTPDCITISGTPYSGCKFIFSTNHAIYHIHLAKHEARFGAYLYAYMGQFLASCHSLGYQISTTKDMNSLTQFHAEEYLSSLKSDFCQGSSTTASTPEDTTASTPEDTTASTPEDTTASTPEDTTASTAQPEETTETTESVQTTTSNATGITMTTDSPLGRHESNKTLLEAEDKAEEIIKTLGVDIKTTSAYKRTKISVQDKRTSTTVIGIGGIVFIVMTALTIILLDFVKFVLPRYVRCLTT